MSDDPDAPRTIDELSRYIFNSPRVIPVGNRTKPRLSECGANEMVSMRGLSGIIEYEPSEFTFTAQAGTTVAEIREALSERNQYLPFDPLLVDAGATIGGTVASGLSGPGRFRFGGVRDFLIGVKILEGEGRVAQFGGKVVKNAAGFDVPKFLVGSMGRFAPLVEVSFKVFPKPPAQLTLEIKCDSHQQAIERMTEVAVSRWEADAVDYRPSRKTVYVRLAGPLAPIEWISKDVRRQWNSAHVMDPDAASTLWQSIREMRWQSDDLTTMTKIPTTSESYHQLQSALSDDEDIAVHVSVAAGVTWIASRDEQATARLDQHLRTLGLAGLVIRGESESHRIGTWKHTHMSRLLKDAMDPLTKYPEV